MSNEAFVGTALVVIALIFVPLTLVRGEILTNWPMKPVNRRESPELFWLYIFGLMAAGAFGLGVLLSQVI
jgi:hypothetical protein